MFSWLRRKPRVKKVLVVYATGQWPEPAVVKLRFRAPDSGSMEERLFTIKGHFYGHPGCGGCMYRALWQLAGQYPQWRWPGDVDDEGKVQARKRSVR